MMFGIRTKVALLAAALALAAVGTYIMISSGVRAQTPGPGSQSSFQAEAAKRALPAELEISARRDSQAAVALPKSEDFEGAWPNNWQLLSTDPMYWGPNQCLAYGGSYDGWSARFDGSGYPSHTDYPTCANHAGYPNDFLSAMVYGPFSTVGASSGAVDSKVLINTELGVDVAGVIAKGSNSPIDCTELFIDYDGEVRSGNWGGWIDWTEDLASFSYVGNLLGYQYVCVAFLFWSDSTANNYPGFFLDNISISTGDGPTPTPTPTPPPGDGDRYYFAEGFTGNFWLTFIAIMNPGDVDANVTATFNLDGAPPVVKNLVVPAHSRRTIPAHDPAYGPGPGWAFGTVIESDQPIAAQQVLIDPVGGLAHGTIGERD